MLTKQDLNSIRVVVKDEIKSELLPVRKDISNLQKDVTGLQKDMTVVKTDITNLKDHVIVVKNGVRKLRKDLKKTIDFFDKAKLDTRAKVNKTRSELGLNEVEFAY